MARCSGGSDACSVRICSLNKLHKRSRLAPLISEPLALSLCGRDVYQAIHARPFIFRLTVLGTLGPCPLLNLEKSNELGSKTCACYRPDWRPCDMALSRPAGRIKPSDLGRLHHMGRVLSLRGRYPGSQGITGRRHLGSDLGGGGACTDSEGWWRCGGCSRRCPGRR